MSDGERLVWAATYALVFDRSGDAVCAARSAAFAVEGLRSAGQQKLSTGGHALAQIDARDFLDEIVNVP
jgi:hypothetical protein